MDIAQLVVTEVESLAKSGIRGIEHNPPGRSLAAIAYEITEVDKIRKPLNNYIRRNWSDQDAQSVHLWLEEAKPVMNGIEEAMNTILGIERLEDAPPGGTIYTNPERYELVKGGIAGHAWMLDAAIKLTGKTELYTDTAKLRDFCLSWKSYDAAFKKQVQDTMDTIHPPILSFKDFAALDPHMAEAYTRADEYLKCGGRGIKGHGHDDVEVPTYWIEDVGFLQPDSKSALFLNYALSTEMGGGKLVGVYGSDTCPWDGYMRKTPAALFGMIADKSAALSGMFASLKLTDSAPDDLTVPLQSLAQTYANISRYSASALDAIQPITHRVSAF